MLFRKSFMIQIQEAPCNVKKVIFGQSDNIELLSVQESSQFEPKWQKFKAYVQFRKLFAEVLGVHLP